jgi:hypothetical protein
MEKCIKTKINEQVIINKPIKEFYIKSKEDIIDHVTDVFIYTKYKIYSIPLYYYIPELYFGIYNEENELKMKNKIITYKISLKNTYYIYAIKIYQSKKEIKDNEILIEYDEEKLGEFNENESIKRDGINFTLLEELEDDCDIVLNNKLIKLNETKIKKVYEGVNVIDRKCYMYKIGINDEIKHEYMNMIYKKIQLVAIGMYDIKVSMSWNELDVVYC